MTEKLFVPRLNRQTIAFLKKIITPESLIFETGSGTSTIWFGRHAKKVVSLENNGDWRDRMQGYIEEEGLKNIKLYFDPKYPEKDFHNILEKEDAIQYDIVLHDGPFDASKRIAAMKFIHLFVKPDGYLIIDDTHSLPVKDGIQKYFDCLDWERLDIPYGKDNFGHGKSATVYRNQDRRRKLLEF